MEIKISVDALVALALNVANIDRDLVRRFRFEVGEGETRDPRDPDLLVALKARWDASPSSRERAAMETMIAHLESAQLAANRLNKVSRAVEGLTDEQREQAKRIADAMVAVAWHEAYRFAQHDIAATSDPTR